MASVQDLARERSLPEAARNTSSATTEAGTTLAKVRPRRDPGPPATCRIVVIILLTTPPRQYIVDGMKAEPRDFAHVVEALVANVSDLLDSPEARDRVRAVHHLAAGLEALERQVLLDAQASGMTWADIGAVYGVSRQAAHRRFADETVVPSDYFDALLKDLDTEAEVVPTLAQAAKRARHAAESR